MMASQVDLLSPPGKFAVVQLTERNYPGVVVQGDTLHSFKEQVQRMARLLDSKEFEELAEEIEDLKEQLGGALSIFERICTEKGISLPYT